MHLWWFQSQSKHSSNVKSQIFTNVGVWLAPLNHHNSKTKWPISMKLDSFSYEYMLKIMFGHWTQISKVTWPLREHTTKSYLATLILSELSTAIVLIMRRITQFPCDHHGFCLIIWLIWVLWNVDLMFAPENFEIQVEIWLTWPIYTRGVFSVKRPAEKRDLCTFYFNGL